MSINPYYIIKSPLLTEESNLQTAVHNKYQFRVDPKANKAQIRDAVESLFNVKVTDVNTMNYIGKMGRRLNRGSAGRKRSWKKAIVTLRDGDKIELI